MIFSIYKTSDSIFFNQDKPPCKDAKLHEWMGIMESRSYDPYTRESIIVENPIIKKCWVIEINTLEDLLNLSREVEAELIISNESIYDGHPYIEIYDEYRE